MVKKEPNWYPIINPVFSETNAELEATSSANDTSFLQDLPDGEDENMVLRDTGDTRDEGRIETDDDNSEEFSSIPPSGSYECIKKILIPS